MNLSLISLTIDPMLARRVQKYRRWIIAFAALSLVLSLMGGIAFWINPPVEYYGKWMWNSELRAQTTNITCVQNPLTRWYELIIQVVPAPAIFICFDTNTEAMNWMLDHLTETPY